MVKLLDDGVRDYVVKPFSERELMVRVRNAVLAEQARAQMQTLQTPPRTRTALRTNSWRCSVTNCAIRSRRS